MSDKLKNCPQCEKLFVPEPPEELCVDCAFDNEQILERVDNAIEQQGKKTPKAIADYTGIPLATVKQILKTSLSRAHDTLPDALCTQCEKRPAQKASDLCLQCRLSMYRSLGDTADELQERVVFGEPEPDTIKDRLSIGNTLAEKRRRTGSYRFDPSPKLRKR